MTTVAYPLVYAAVLSFAESALPGVRVIDGYDTSEDPSDVILIGVPNITDTEAIAAGSFNQEQAGFGANGPISETGSVNGIALAWNGDGDAAAARLVAVGFIATLGAAIRANRSLGISGFDVVAQLSSGEVAEDKVDGATCAISFTVAYKANVV